MPCIIASKIKCNTGIKATLFKYAHSYKELLWKEKPFFYVRIGPKNNC